MDPAGEEGGNIDMKDMKEEKVQIRKNKHLDSRTIKEMLFEQYSVSIKSLWMKLCCPLKVSPRKACADTRLMWLCVACEAGVCVSARVCPNCSKTHEALWRRAKGPDERQAQVREGRGGEENGDDARWEAWMRASDCNQEEWI